MATTKRHVGVGVIGLGNFAQQQHLPNLARIDAARLIGVCDIDPTRAESAGRAYGAESSHTDYRALLDEARIEAVVIAVRDDLQASIALDALRAGKHVYVEKPLSIDPVLCEQVQQVADQAQRRVAVGFNRRFAPIYQQMRSIVRQAGGVFNVQIDMSDDAWRWAKGYPPGYLLAIDVGHLFDLLRWITGDAVTQVACMSSRGDDDALLVRTAGGCVATICFSGHATIDKPKERTQIITQRGCVVAEDFVELRTYGLTGVPELQRFAGHTQPHSGYLHRPMFELLGLDAMRALRRSVWSARQTLQDESITASKRDELQRFVDTTIPNFLRDQGWLAAVRAFVESIRDGTSTDHATARDAAHAARATAAALQSRVSGGVIDVVRPET